MTEILDRIVMNWQTGKELTKLARLEHLRSSIFDEDVVQGALDRSQHQVDSIGVRAMVRAAQAMVDQAVIDNIDEDPGADRLALTFDSLTEILRGESA